MVADIPNGSLPNAPPVALGDEFARELPELAAPWRALEPQDPALVVLDESLAGELGLEPTFLRNAEGVRFLLGDGTGVGPVAQVYAGHQFGVYVPRLGDGRALLVGEITDPLGGVHDIHLKGSGRTPFARADGFATLDAMLREYLLGEAMHALGVPTTRALAVISTGLRVPREGSLLPGAILARVASSHLRVGTFQYARSTGDLDLLRRLADHAIARHYPEIANSGAPYRELLRAVVAAQASLTASWMLVGFVHGVMNTDNMTISGETIDYGPCAFIDVYDPATVFSSIDHSGRYAYGNQPRIALWNLTRFAETLLPLIADDQEQAVAAVREDLSGFTTAYDSAWIGGMRAKLGIGAAGLTGDTADDEAVARLAVDMLDALHAQCIDYTGFFRALVDAARGDETAARGLFERPQDIGDWFETWLGLSPDGDAMDLANPLYIPRNHLVDEALNAAIDGDLSPFTALLEAVKQPFTKRPGLERYTLPAPPGSGRHVTYCGT